MQHRLVLGLTTLDIVTRTDNTTNLSTVITLYNGHSVPQRP